jgi:exopolyphosphatase / guanosine-5'-triphosphate,3'-diphosphate pyrophosphatase
VPAPGETIAAVDLGSNSFHMIIAEAHPEGLLVLDRLREMVQLAAGLKPGGSLDPAAEIRALGCLRRFGERLASLHTRSVRAVGTNALRKAAGAREFLSRAERELGHPIHVISGTEEARLIYAGVAYSLPPPTGSRLVVDIGGGSTEFIVGSGPEPDELASIAVGCVSLTERHFTGGELGSKRLGAARTEALRKLEPIFEGLTAHGWSEAVGASGTIRAVATVAERLGLGANEVTPAAIAAVSARLAEASNVSALELPGLSGERRPIFPAGLVVLAAIFELLEIEHMQVASGALREGLLLDLVGRLTDHDVRDASVSHLAARLQLDRRQGERVAATATRLFAALTPDWIEASAENAKLLEWGARLHEVGLVIAHPGYHRHGAYVLEHAELAGFSSEEQARLALMVRAHRKALPTAEFRALPPRWRRSTRRLAILLRIAVVLNRARAGDGELPVRVRAKGRRLELDFPPGWLDAHPLSAADLARERELLARAGYALTFR